MQKIDFRIWRENHARDWSVQLNGNVYEALPADLVKQLVLHAMIEADESLVAATIN